MRKIMLDSVQYGMPSRLKLILAFATIYLVWGSTYLAIKFAIESIPTFLLGGLRFTTAGLILYAFLRYKGVPKPELRHWKSAAIVGLMLLTVGNGAVVWSEHIVPSGLVAMVFATIPLWTVLLIWVWKGNARPGASTTVGIFIGLLGLGFLVGPANTPGGPGVDPLAASVLVLASLSWAVGSIYSKGAPHPTSHLLAASMQMTAGGTMLLLIGTLMGEWSEVSAGLISMRSLLSFTYLVVFGSIIAFSAYVWLLRIVSPAYVSTHTYVNPLVAVVLGWAGGGEQLSGPTLTAAIIVVISVVLITSFRGTEPVDKRLRACSSPACSC